MNAPTAPPLGTTAAAPSAPMPTGKPPTAAVPSSPPPSPAAYKIMLEANVGRPRLGQTVEFTARVAPSRGAFENAVFSITGPGLGGGVNMTAQSTAPGVFKASYAFLEGGRFDVTFATQADGKALKAGRTLVAGAAAEPAPDPGPKPPGPAPTSSVKWM